jgi:fructose-1,6-bisphosphatase/inositol monophosphatase family enzyme
MDEKRILISQPLGDIPVPRNAPVYYAYPPTQDSAAFTARNELQKLIDAKSSGIYRYGSACIGLYNLVQGKHFAFIGHQIRVWDAIAFLPILRAYNINVRYSLNGMSITLVASRNQEFLKQSAEIFQQNQGIILLDYEIGNELKAIEI